LFEKIAQTAELNLVEGSFTNWVKKVGKSDGVTAIEYLALSFQNLHHQLYLHNLVAELKSKALEVLQ